MTFKGGGGVRIPPLVFTFILNLVHNVSKYMQQTLFRCFFPSRFKVYFDSTRGAGIMINFDSALA